MIRQHGQVTGARPIVFQPRRGGPWPTFDSQEIKQWVVLNLVVNAPRLDWARTARSGSTSAHGPTGWAEMVFADDGLRDELPRWLENIFEPFFTRRRGRQGGTGLGLSITHRIISQHPGREGIAAQQPRARSGGSTFVVPAPGPTRPRGKEAAESGTPVHAQKGSGPPDPTRKPTRPDSIPWLRPVVPWNPERSCQLTVSRETVPISTLGWVVTAAPRMCEVIESHGGRRWRKFTRVAFRILFADDEGASHAT